MGKGKHSKHRQSLVTLSRRHSIVQSLDNLELDGPSPIRRLPLTNQKSVDSSNLQHNSSSKVMLSNVNVN